MNLMEVLDDLKRKENNSLSQTNLHMDEEKKDGGGFLLSEMRVSPCVTL